MTESIWFTDTLTNVHAMVRPPGTVPADLIARAQ
jgi:hypothetical protein